MTTMNLQNSSGNSEGQISIPSDFQIPIPPGLIQKPRDKKISKDVENKIIAWADEQYNQLRNIRSRVELQWYLNLAFYFGKQYAVKARLAQSGTKLMVPHAPPWRTRLIINRIRPIIRTELSKLTSQKPNVTVTPASSEDRDIFAAQAAEQLWEAIYRDYRLKPTIRKAVWWTCVTGCGYIKTYWDSNVPMGMIPDVSQQKPSEPLIPSSTQQMSYGQSQLTQTTDSNQPQGDFCFLPITPFHIFVPNLREEELEEQPYCMEVQARSSEWVKWKYPQLGDVEPDTAAASEILSESFLNMMTGEAASKKDCIVVKEIYIKPGMMPSVMPDGGVITTVGNRVAQYYEGMPYEHGKYPYAKIDHIPSGKYYSDSTIIDLIPLQKELNRTRSQIVENKNRMAKMQLLAAKGSVDPKLITSEPGLVIQYTPGFDPPRPLELNPLPAYVTQELDRILQDFNDISGQHEVSKGQAPPGVTAATAISYLQEQDESMLSHTYDSVEEAIEKIAFMTLALAKQYWTVPKEVKITSADGTFDVLSFNASDLKSSADIKVESGSSLPTSKAARISMIMDMMKMGFINPNDGLEVLDMGGLNKITDKIKVDKRQAQRENLKMAVVTQDQINQYNMLQMQQAGVAQDPTTGQMGPANPKFVDPNTGQPIQPPPIIPVNTWDNHAIHIETHNNYRKSQAFEELSDVNRQLFEAHVQDHIAALQTEYMQMVPKGPGQSNFNQSQSGPATPPPPEQNTGYQPDMNTGGEIPQ